MPTLVNCFEVQTVRYGRCTRAVGLAKEFVVEYAMNVVLVEVVHHQSEHKLVQFAILLEA